MKIGTSIKQCRVEKGLSQENLSAKIGLSRTSLSQIENNVKTPSKTTLAKLAKALKVPEVYFYLIALEREDVAKDRRELYDAIFPSIKDMVNKLVL